MINPSQSQLLRSLPSIDQLMARPSLASALASHPRARFVAALRMAVDAARTRILSGEPRGFEDGDVVWALETLTKPKLQRVLNATGVILHTNLGRAPLAAAAVERVAQVAAHYSNLELDLESGERGSRYAPVLGLLRDLTGAESAIVVNNNAAAVLLVLAALSDGREAIVSRGELVEIGGGFRIPDVMRQSGARLVEVGTTNRTRLSDYEAAISSSTGLLVKIHKSNFAQVGFVQDVEIAEIVELGKRLKIPTFEDLGSGCLEPLELAGSEPTVRNSVSSGIDVISFSGDKLLGGPQCGVIVGRAALIERVARHPLNRALRVDKMTVAALEATLELYRDGRSCDIPTWQMLTQTEATLHQRAKRLFDLLQSKSVDSAIIGTEGQVGGGAMPLTTLSSFACAISVPNVQQFHDRLRAQDPPVIARVADEKLLLDVRCLTEEDLDQAATAAHRALEEHQRAQ